MIVAVKQFGKKLLEIRAEKDLTQEQMAELCGISTRHYRDLEHGTAHPSLDTALQISDALNFSLDELKHHSGSF